MSSDELYSRVVALLRSRDTLSAPLVEVGAELKCAYPALMIAVRTIKREPRIRVFRVNQRMYLRVVVPHTSEVEHAASVAASEALWARLANRTGVRYEDDPRSLRERHVQMRNTTIHNRTLGGVSWT
jgi:hypothetical protein